MRAVQKTMTLELTRLLGQRVERGDHPARRERQRGVALAGILESDLHRLTAGAQELEQLGRDRDVGEATIGQAAAPRQVEERPGGAGNAKRRHAAERDGW